MTGVLSVICYYASVLALNFDKVSQIFQPQLNQVFYSLLSTAKVLTMQSWIAICLVPFLALVPDFAWLCWERLFYPSPVDTLLREQVKENVDNETQRRDAKLAN